MYKKLIEEMDSYLELGVPGYDCMVYKDGVCVFRHMNGYTDLEKKTRHTGKERYNLYSCSKPLTCTAALQLYEKGLYDLDDKLSDYMPEFERMYVKTEEGVRKAEKAITIRHLFTMTAGFSYDVNSPMLELGKKETNGKCPTREMMRYLAKEPLLFEPGERFAYSLCHDVLAAFVEVVSGVRFSEYVKKNIFDVLGMNDSTYLLDDEDAETMTPQYERDGDTNEVRECQRTIKNFKFGSEYESGGAGCISSVEDYMKFLEAMRIGDVILKKETIELMSTNQLSEEQAKPYWMTGYGSYGYGLGVRCSNGADVTEFGWDGAAGSILSIDPVNNITIMYAQHLLGHTNDRFQIIPIIKNILT